MCSTCTCVTHMSLPQMSWPTSSLTKYFSLRKLKQSLLSGGIEKAIKLFSLGKARAKWWGQPVKAACCFRWTEKVGQSPKQNPRFLHAHPFDSDHMEEASDALDPENVHMSPTTRKEACESPRRQHGIEGLAQLRTNFKKIMPVSSETHFE